MNVPLVWVGSKWNSYHRRFSIQLIETGECIEYFLVSFCQHFKSVIKSQATFFDIINIWY